MKKSIKNKLTAAVLTSAMLISAVPAAYADTPDITVMLNGSYVEFADQNPANVDSRVLVPVRAVLEKMGASVEWNEAEKQVIVKKDGKEIKLTINDSSIIVDGVAKTVDVPPQIINDRTMLPIRAVVEELGCSVGWDDNEKTVLIIDWNDYENEIQAKASKFYSYIEEQGKNIPKSYTENINGSFNFSTNNDYTETAGHLDISLDFSADSKAKENVSSTTTKLTFGEQTLKSLLIDLLGLSEDADVSKIKDVNMEIVSDGDAVYIKTDLITKLAEVSEDKDLKAMAVIANDKAWLKVDWTKLFGLEEQGELYSEYIKALKDPQNANAIDNLVEYAKNITYSDVMSAMMVDSVANAFSNIYSDQNFKYEKNDSGYTVDLNMNNEMFRDVLKSQYESMGVSADEALLDETLNMMNMSLIFSIKGDNNGNSTSKVEFIYDVSEVMNISLKLNSQITAADIETVEVPTSAIDIMSLYEMTNK